MFAKGHISEQNAPYASDSQPLSPKTRDLQNKRLQGWNVGQSLCKKHPKSPEDVEDNPSHHLSSLDSTDKADKVTAEEDRSPLCQDRSVLGQNAISCTKHDAEEEKEDEEQGSNNIVEHILKELKGINKIQEEISDLRQYLTSVRGSVDEVSCCVDAVLSEIGELYSGAAAAPHPSPVSLTPRIRRGSLGRQNAITCLHGKVLSPMLDFEKYRTDSGFISSTKSTKHWQGDEATLRSVHQIDNDMSEQNSNMDMLSPTKPDLCYLELHCGQTYQSTSSLSSCHSSNYPEAGFLSGDTDCDTWLSVGTLHTTGRDRSWSEDDISSCANSREELQNDQDVWKRCTAEGTQSSTAGHSSHTSSEHLSLLFGQQYNSPISPSSKVNWRRLTHEANKENLECDCAANCPFSHSSGYHTKGPCGNDLGSGPSRSLSYSTVLLTDCDDVYREPYSPADEYPSSGDTLDLGSADSLDKEWTDHSISRGEVEESFSSESSEIDFESISKRPNEEFNASSFNKVAFTFGSALKGALRKLEISNPEEVKNDAEKEDFSFPVREASESKDNQTSAQFTEWDVDFKDNLIQFASPKESSEMCKTNENLSLSLHLSPYKPTHSPNTPAEIQTTEISQMHKELVTDKEQSILVLTPEYIPAIQTEYSLSPVLGTDETRLSPINENDLLAEENQRKPTDASHKERIANFQRILKEKRQTQQRLSRSTQGSQGSHGSQVSQASQFQDEFIPGILKLFLFLILVHISKYSKNVFEWSVMS